MRSKFGPINQLERETEEIYEFIAALETLHKAIEVFDGAFNKLSPALRSRVFQQYPFEIKFGIMTGGDEEE